MGFLPFASSVSHSRVTSACRNVTVKLFRVAFRRIPLELYDWVTRNAGFCASTDLHDNDRDGNVDGLLRLALSVSRMTYSNGAWPPE